MLTGDNQQNCIAPAYAYTVLAALPIGLTTYRKIKLFKHFTKNERSQPDFSVGVKKTGSEDESS